jgi:hypothetical protein
MLSEMIAQAEAEKESLENLIRKLRELKAFCDNLPRQSVAAENIQMAMLQVGNKPKTQFQKVANFILSNGNQPQTAAAIRAATGVSRSALSLLMYRSHKDDFESVPVPGYERLKAWRVKTDPDRPIERRADRIAHAILSDEIPAEGDFSGLTQVECAQRILKEQDNKKLHVATIAKEALRRGYVPRAKGEYDRVEYRLTQSLLADLGRRKEIFEDMGGGYFRLLNPDEVIEDPERTGTVLFS